MPEPVALKTSTTVGPTSPSVTCFSTFGFAFWAMRHTLPPLRCGRAIETSSPFVVTIDDVGPAGSGPTGGAVAAAFPTSAAANDGDGRGDGDPHCW